MRVLKMVAARKPKGAVKGARAKVKERRNNFCFFRIHSPNKRISDYWVSKIILRLTFPIKSGALKIAALPARGLERNCTEYCISQGVSLSLAHIVLLGFYTTWYKV